MLSATFKLDTSKADAYEKKVINGLDKTVKDMADAVIIDIRASWSPESPSAPGTAPAVVTGELDRSIKREKTGRTALGQFTSHDNAIAYVIRAGAPYAGILEGYLDRPFFAPAMERAMVLYPVVVRKQF